MIFQDPLSALNPVYSVGWQLSEMFRVHQHLSRSAARERAIALLEHVGIPGARARIDDYPHQFSGGMRQRLIIAMALSVDPDLVACGRTYDGTGRYSGSADPCVAEHAPAGRTASD